MTELEWLKQQSGMTDDELKAMEAVAGHAKFVGMLQKIIGENEGALKAKADAEQTRIDFEDRYNKEFVPEMRKVTSDALRAQGEAARLKAELDKAREYGIVPEPETPVARTEEPPRASGSPDPNAITRNDFGRFSAMQANTIVALNDLNAEHFRLFGQPLSDTQSIFAEVNREHTLGNKQFGIKDAWERKFNVPAKREELKATDQKKHDDEIRAQVIKEERESNVNGSPNIRGHLSRFSTYKPTDSGNEPWKAPHSKQQANRPWRENATNKIREAIAA